MITSVDLGVGIVVTSLSTDSKNLAHWLLFAQGRNADDKQFSQELNEEPRTADVITCLTVTRARNS
jgi:hypothetical protein